MLWGQPEQKNGFRFSGAFIFSCDLFRFWNQSSWLITALSLLNFEILSAITSIIVCIGRSFSAGSNHFPFSSCFPITVGLTFSFQLYSCHFTWCSINSLFSSTTRTVSRPLQNSLIPCGSRGHGIPTLYKAMPILFAFSSSIPSHLKASRTSLYDLPAEIIPSFALLFFQITLSIWFALTNSCAANPFALCSLKSCSLGVSEKRIFLGKSLYSPKNAPLGTMISSFSIEVSYVLPESATSETIFKPTQQPLYLLIAKPNKPNLTISLTPHGYK